MPMEYTTCCIVRLAGSLLFFHAGLVQRMDKSESSTDTQSGRIILDGHMLQLRQCKLAFPSTYLMVGVCSDELVRKHKASPVLTSAERYESVRHCKWVDQVVEEAPWCVDEAFLKKWEIDYVAHDEEPYQSAGSDDVYAYAKSIGQCILILFCVGISLEDNHSYSGNEQALSYPRKEPMEFLLQSSCNVSSKGTEKGKFSISLLLLVNKITQRALLVFSSEYDNKFIKLGLPDLCSTRNASEAGTSGSKAHEEMLVDSEERTGTGMMGEEGLAGGLDLPSVIPEE